MRVHFILPYVTNMTKINGGSSGYQLLIKCVTVSDQPPAEHKLCLVSSCQIYSFSSETQIFASKLKWIPAWWSKKKKNSPTAVHAGRKRRLEWVPGAWGVQLGHPAPGVINRWTGSLGWGLDDRKKAVRKRTPFHYGARGGVVVKALCYKPAGRGFDSRWC